MTDTTTYNINLDRGGIKTVFGRGGYSPMIFCHQCGERIRKATECTVYFRHPRRGKKVSHLFAHKKCSYTLEQTNPGEWSAYIDLRVFLLYLSINLGMGENDWKKARELAATGWF